MSGQVQDGLMLPWSDFMPAPSGSLSAPQNGLAVNNGVQNGASPFGGGGPLWVNNNNFSVSPTQNVNPSMTVSPSLTVKPQLTYNMPTYVSGGGGDPNAAYNARSAALASAFNNAGAAATFGYGTGLPYGDGATPVTNKPWTYDTYGNLVQGGSTYDPSSPYYNPLAPYDTYGAAPAAYGGGGSYSSSPNYSMDVSGVVLGGGGNYGTGTSYQGVSPTGVNFPNNAGGVTNSYNGGIPSSNSSNPGWQSVGIQAPGPGFYSGGTGTPTPTQGQPGPMIPLQQSYVAGSVQPAYPPTYQPYYPNSIQAGQIDGLMSGMSPYAPTIPLQYGPPVPPPPFSQPAGNIWGE